MVWVFRKRVRGWAFYNRRDGRDLSTLQPDQVKKFLARSGPHFVVIPTALAEQLYPTLPSGYRKFSTSGFDIAKARRVELTLILKNT